MATTFIKRLQQLSLKEESLPSVVDPSGKSKKFGTINGVFIPSILTILGVVMYLRMGWIVGNLGMFQTFLIVTLSSAVTFITALSISSTSTNMKVGAGGAYYMVSRSFGIESGAAIGIPLYMAQAIGIAFYISGFSESIQEIIPWVPLPVIGIVVLSLITALANFSADFALKTQIVIFVLIGISIFAIFTGSSLQGFNFGTDQAALHQTSFWTVFAVFFPAVTGILSGVSMSGDLKDPGASIPVGTIAAVIVGYVIYLAVPWILWHSAPAKTLVEDSMILQEISSYGPAILAGIWGATLSSALGSMLAAPRTLKALADDRVVPKYFGKTSLSGSPQIATVVTFVIASLCLFLGDLNVIAPILTMFFLTTYGVLNLVSGGEGLIGSASWRPTFNVHWIVSIVGAFLCVGIMLMINAGATYIAILICTGLYFWVRHRELRVNFSDMRPGMLLYSIRNSVYQLDKYEIDERSWRPNIFLVSGVPQKNPYLLELATDIANGKGFTTLGVALSQPLEGFDDSQKIKSSEQVIKKWVKDRNMSTLVKLGVGVNDAQFTEQIVNYYGLGSVRPNIFFYDFTESFETLNSCLSFLQCRKRNGVVVRSNGINSVEEITSRIKSPQMNIWWNPTDESNSILMLTMAHLLRQANRWSNSIINLTTIVKDDAEELRAEKALGNLIQESRLKNIFIKAIKKEEKDNFEIMSQASKYADISFIGIPSSEKEGLNSEKLKDLFEKTNDLGLTIYCSSGKNINLKKVFVE